MDAEVDVLVAGAGAAGMTAALVCALQGLDVLLCEKSSQVGGTTATSAGTIWVPGTKQAVEAGFAGDIPEARRYLDSIIGPATDDRREVYLATGPELVDYLAQQQRGEVLALQEASRTICPTGPARPWRAVRSRRCRSMAGCSARTSRCCGRRSVNSWRSAA